MASSRFSVASRGYTKAFSFKFPTKKRKKEVAGLQEDNFQKAVVFSSLGAREAQAE